jgi:[acyl-carrier-protein] S-malonyltransferase
VKNSLSVALIFPGQGSQAVGMGKGLADTFPESRAVFAEVDDALGERLSETIWNGSADTLTLTRNTQPALMAVSMAALRALEAGDAKVAGKVAFVAGHSLGEYTALAAAGSFTVGEAARLLRVRGDAMQAAVPVGEGAMAAIIGLELDAVRAVAASAAEGQVCAVANDNGAGQVVVSGHKAAVERAVALAQEKGAKRAILLPVSAPFHCALMKPAADAMAEALAKTPPRTPSIPLVANVLAAPLANADEIRRCLVEQVTGVVRWRESVAWLAANGVDCFIELGAGKVLSGLVKRIAPQAATLAVGTPDDIPAALDRLH